MSKAPSGFAPRNKNIDFSEGSVFRLIVAMAVPATLATIVNVLYSIVDRMFISHIPEEGTLALTGIGLAFPIILVVTAFTNLFGSGGAPLFSIAQGKKDGALASKYLHNAFFMLLSTGVALTVIGLAVKAPVLMLIGASADTFPYANDYLGIYLLGTVFSMTATGMNPYINAQGFAKFGMGTVIVGAAANLVLDPVFIFVFHMGVRGAAIATVIAQFLSALWAVLFLTGERPGIPLRFSKLIPEWRVILNIMKLGVAEFCFSLTNSLVTMLFNQRLSVLGGDIWVAAMTICSTVREFYSTVIHGVTHATRPILGYNYGAEQYGRVKEGIKWMFLICISYMLIVWGVLMAFPGAIVGLFNTDPGLMKTGTEAIRLYFMATFFIAFQMTGQATFTALGKAKHALFFSIFRKVLIVIPAALILPHLFHLGVRGVMLAEPLSDIVGGLACFITMIVAVTRELNAKAEES